MGWSGMEARNKGVSQKQGVALEALDKLWYTRKKVKFQQVMGLHSIVLLLLQLLTPLAKLLRSHPSGHRASFF